MYYLLENNKIIDSTNIRVDLDLPFEVDFYVQKDEIVLTIDHIHFEHISIIKKAENVYDLIEKDKDLIKYKYSIDEIKFEIVTSLCESPDGIKTGSLLTKYSNRIIPFFKVLAIYKLDSEGNYIKVWEVKEDES